MASSAVRVERTGPIVTVILDRPEVRNAIDRPTADRLADAFRAFDADGSAAVAVLWGAGGTFCSGADLRALAATGIPTASNPTLGARTAGDPTTGDTAGDPTASDTSATDTSASHTGATDTTGSDPTAGAANRLAPDGDGPLGPTRLRLGKPVIAAVSGYAVAGGLELALWCDMRVVEQSATFGVYCRRWGVPLVDGGTVRLPRIVGLGRALDMIMTGRAVDAREAQQIGLADRVVPDGQARSAAEALAAQLASFPQECLRHDRLSVYDALGRGVADGLRVEYDHGVQSLAAGALDGARRFARGEGRHGTNTG